MNGCNHENPQDDDMIMEPTPSKRHLEQDTFDTPEDDVLDMCLQV